MNRKTDISWKLLGRRQVIHLIFNKIFTEYLLCARSNDKYLDFYYNRKRNGAKMISLWLVMITRENYWYARSLKIFIVFTLLQKNALALKHSFCPGYKILDLTQMF